MKDGFFEGKGKVKSRSTDYIYNVPFKGVIKQTNDPKERKKSLENMRLGCGCWISTILRNKPVPEAVGDLYGDDRPPEARKVKFPICFHGLLTIYQLKHHHGIDGYGQFGLDTQTNDFAKYEARRICYPMSNMSRIRSEIRNFYLQQTNFFNPLRKILGVPLVL